ncbi:hypothetical protein T07_4824 [Trichinella nelsoni]|uniref:Uncharacterized protein n=1 Tax=Trichinella nelsoni TaxID=6336 RepID=A0A0V0RH03_9BILA|nr:hypothetical protein T07_4824 [Trichinella nelsoni]
MQNGHLEPGPADVLVGKFHGTNLEWETVVEYASEDVEQLGEEGQAGASAALGAVVHRIWLDVQQSLQSVDDDVIRSDAIVDETKYSSRQAFGQQPPLVVDRGHFDQRQGRWRRTDRRTGKKFRITRLERQNAAHHISRCTVPSTQQLPLAVGQLSVPVAQGVVPVHNPPFQSPAQRLQVVDHLTLAVILEQQIRQLLSLTGDAFGEQQHRPSQLFQLHFQAVQLAVNRQAWIFHRPHFVDRVHQQLQADHEPTAILQPGPIQAFVRTTTTAQSTIRELASRAANQQRSRGRCRIHQHVVMERLQVVGHPRPPSTARAVSHD